MRWSANDIWIVASAALLIPNVNTETSFRHNANILVKLTDYLHLNLGGLKFAAFDSLDPNGLINVFSGISSESGNIYDQSIQVFESYLFFKSINYLTVNNTG